MFRFWAYVCIKLWATVACGGDVSENTFAFQSIKVTESNLTPSFLYIPGLCVTWWILCHQVKGNLQVNGSFRVGLMSVICMAIYKCTNNNNISKAYSRLRDMWVNSYENDYNAYEFLTFGAKKKPAKTFLSPLSFASHWYLPKSSSFTLVITNWLCVLLSSLGLDCKANESLFLIHEMLGARRPVAVQLKVTFAPISVIWFRGTPINSDAWTVGKNILQWIYLLLSRSAGLKLIQL